MDDIPLSTLAVTLVLCLAASGFFSAAETCMMAVSRYRLKSLADAGQRGAQLAIELLERIDRLLGVILLCSNLINAASAALATVITIRLLGNDEVALGVATIAITFAILIFSELTPKVVAATYPEQLAVRVSYPLVLLQKLFYPVVGLINVIVGNLLRLAQLKSARPSDLPLSSEELRILVLEAGKFIGQKHHSILMNLFELQNNTVDDVMIPRHQIEAIDLNSPVASLREQLATCHHTRLPVYEGKLDNLVGIVHARKVLSVIQEGITDSAIRSIMRAPYFIPAGTPLFTQLQNFQENHRRIGCVVDEYGELMGVVTLEDILELIIGEFTTQTPSQPGLSLSRDESGHLVEGSIPLRDLNRRLGLDFSLSGPKTLNGLIVEFFQDIPEAGTCMTIAGNRLEVMQTQDRSVKMVRIYFPANPS